VRNVRLWRGLLGVDKRTVIEDIEIGEEGTDGVELVVWQSPETVETWL
jgi:transposase